MVCVLGQYNKAHEKWGRFIRFSATAAPLEPDLVWVDADTGETKVRDHPKTVGSCASAAMVGVSYRDIYDMFLMLRGRHPDASTAPIWLWLLACRCLRYVTGKPSGSGSRRGAPIPFRHSVGVREVLRYHSDSWSEWE